LTTGTRIIIAYFTAPAIGGMAFRTADTRISMTYTTATAMIQF
jgi:hypothetical protein